MKKFLKKKIIIMMIALVLVATTTVGVTWNKSFVKSKASENIKTSGDEEDYDEDDYEVNPEDNIEPENMDDEIVPNTEDDEAMRELYNNIPTEQLEKFRAMTDEQIEERELEIMSSYEMGQEFSEEDANFMLFIRYEYNANNASRLWYTAKHNIKNSKKNCGVTASYEGYLETWSGLKNAQYGANVKCKLSKPVKSAKFIVHHTAYGILGTSGKIPTIGITYNGSMSSSSYKKSFTFNKFKKYSALANAYLATWAELVVVTDKGEFNVKSKVYKDWQ